ncbi:MAG: 1-acyl-sn-glycerol-3-phosphate acyltransferase, partial [Saprospiraceae bacterium]
MPFLRALGRLLYFALYTSLKIGQIVLGNLWRGENIPRALRIRQQWANHLLPFIGVQATMQGDPPDFPCILMGNHRSYLDPVLIVRWVLAYGVSKAEVAHWPIIGYGTRVAGVIYLKRENVASRRITLQGIAEKVGEGYP